MIVPGSINPLLLKSAAAATGFQVSRSLRFNSADSAYLDRTPSVAGNRKIWTWSGWVKRSTFGQKTLFSASPSSQTTLWFDGDVLEWTYYSGGYVARLTTAAAYRDPSAWMHVLFALDTTQATADNRMKLYINGSEVTTFTNRTNPALNAEYDINNSISHRIGSNVLYSVGNFDGFIANCQFIDGQQLTPSSFTEVSATTGQLIPKAYTGTYGTNGFYLQFADNSSNTASTLGKDTSGNSNNWTPNNFSVTAGAGNDSLVDSPTSYGTDTGVGNEVRGNYCVLNAVLPYTNVTLSNGNLDFVSGASYRNAVGTIGVSSGKWYWEVLVNTWSSDAGIGITNNPANVIVGFLGSNSSGWAYSPYPIGGNGSKYGNGAYVAYGTTYTNGDTIGVALDADTGTLTFYKNGSSQGTAFTGLATGTYFPALGGGSATSMTLNSGQRAFAYTAPSGFKALCDTNMPAPVVAKPNTLMDVVKYDGNSSTQSITGLAFRPDLVWIKARNTSSYNHFLFDAIRDVNNELNSNTTDYEYTRPAPGSLTAFNSDGFALNTAAGVNSSGTTYVGWCWDAGTTTTTINANAYSAGVPSITSQVRANASAGFSIVSYAGGQGSNFTVGHGLNVQPAFVITKARNAADQWGVYYTNNGVNTNWMLLNSTAAQGTNNGPLTGGAYMVVNSTTLQIASTSFANGGSSMIAYCFSPVVGYSSFGSYVGNGSSDGVFVYTGMRPRWVMIKASSSTGDWYIIDTARDTYNLSGKSLQANSSNAEPSIGGSFSVTDDILSNGFKLRDAGSGSNGSGVTYVYAAFAENPFQYARAR